MQVKSPCIPDSRPDGRARKRDTTAACTQPQAVISLTRIPHSDSPVDRGYRRRASAQGFSSLAAQGTTNDIIGSCARPHKPSLVMTPDANLPDAGVSEWPTEGLALLLRSDASVTRSPYTTTSFFCSTHSCFFPPHEPAIEHFPSTSWRRFVSPLLSSA